MTEEEHVRVPLPDGTRLGARIRRPASSDDEPVPAVLEFIPYRTGDFTAPRDWCTTRTWRATATPASASTCVAAASPKGFSPTSTWSRSCGTAGRARVVGKAAVVRWQRRMMGLSWGGFNALQIAARRAPQRSAIATVCRPRDVSASSPRTGNGRYRATTSDRAGSTAGGRRSSRAARSTRGGSAVRRSRSPSAPAPGTCRLAGTGAGTRCR